MGKQKEKGSDGDKKERDVPSFNPNGPVKVLQRQMAAHQTGYEHPPQQLMGAQRDQVPQHPMVVNNRGNGVGEVKGKGIL